MIRCSRTLHPAKTHPRAIRYITQKYTSLYITKKECVMWYCCTVPGSERMLRDGDMAKNTLLQKDTLCIVIGKASQTQGIMVMFRVMCDGNIGWIYPYNLVEVT
jgi:hypothetical protein